MNSTRLPYWRLSSFYFWYYAALGGFTPYFARWLHDLGQEALAISVLMGLWYAARIIAPPTWGDRAARSPRPLHWLRAGALLALVGFAGFLVAREFAALFIVMLVFGFFCNAILPQFEALTLDTLHGRREDYGRIRVWGSIGFIVVTLGYGALIERHGSAWLPLLMLPLFVAIAASTFANRAPQVEAHHDEPAPGSLLAALRRRGVPNFLLVALLMQLGFGPYYVFFTLHLGEHGHGTDTIGALWALGVLAEILLFVAAPTLLRRHSPRHLMLACLALTAVRWLLIALFPGSLPLLIILQPLHALSFGVFHACCMQLIGVYFPVRLSAQGQALLHAIGAGIGGVLGALLAGVSWELGGGLACFGFGALAVAIGFFVALRLESRGGSHVA